jgi:predicted restriction endonuclease
MSVNNKPTIDPYLFEKQFEAFKIFVEFNSNISFESFSHPVTDEENYKYDIYRDARKNLNFIEWESSDIGSGKIISATIKAIEFPNNNLVPWQSRFGDDKRPHHPLFKAQNSSIESKKIESVLFNLYHNQVNDDESFTELIEIFGKKYPILAYLFFIKDSRKYLPIAPTYFDRAFELLGADFKSKQLCSWGNYSTYLELISDLKYLLIESLPKAEVSLVDAHSFAWILVSKMEKQKKLADVDDYLKLDKTERESIVKSRIGQGRFRESLINYWSSCAVTGCKEQKVLRASHIKPWSESTNEERLSLYNGLLLSPSLDLCFDLGFISFSNSGEIIISDQLSSDDIDSLGIEKGMKLSMLETNHEIFLEYHRENIFKVNG